MSTESVRLRELLDAARDDAPSPADRARIAEKLGARIALVEGSASSPRATSSPTPAAPAPAASSGALGGASVIAAGGVLLAVGIAAVLSLVRGPQEDRLHASTPPSPASTAAASPEVRDGATPPIAASAVTEPAPASASAAASPPTSMTDRPAAAGAPSASAPAAPPASAPAAPPASASSPGVPPAPPVPARRASSLAEELALLRDARAAARSDDPARSLALLDELDRRHPDGVLHEERRAARVVALCAAGDPSAAAEAARFLRELPSSVHAARVRAACAAP